jgi:hypothetical protein
MMVTPSSNCSNTAKQQQMIELHGLVNDILLNLARHCSGEPGVALNVGECDEILAKP